MARAINARGLSKLERFYCEQMKADAVTVRGLSAIAHAVINRCPQLKDVNLTGSGLGSDNGIRRDAVTGMLEAAGRAEEVRVLFVE